MLQEQYMLPCLNKKLFGFECMGCGLQRSVSYLYHGEFVAAFKIYPAIYALILLVIAILISLLYKFKHRNIIINGLAIASVLIIIISFTLKKFI